MPYPLAGPTANFGQHRRCFSSTSAISTTLPESRGRCAPPGTEKGHKGTRDTGLGTMGSLGGVTKEQSWLPRGAPHQHHPFPPLCLKLFRGVRGAMASALEEGSARASHATFTVVSLVLSRAHWPPHLCLWTNHTPLFVTKERRGQGAATANEASPKVTEKSR